MKRLLLILGLWLSLGGIAWPFSASLNFRATAGFVTDGAGQTYVTNADTYPVTRNGLTFGYIAGSIQAADRNSGVDPRFAGINYTSPGDFGWFVLDVPSAGSYDIRIASGDSGGDQSGQLEYVEIFNGADTAGPTLGSSLGILLNGVTGPTLSHYYDSTSIIRTSESNWISANVAVTKSITVFSSHTRIVFVIGKASLSTYSVMAHIEVSDAAPPPTGATIKHRVSQ